MKYITDLRNGLEQLLREEHAYIIGEDIQEPYGGAFKVTRGLSESYPDQIIGVPMCEQGFTGLGVGMAVQGCSVLVEIMFGDFITLICDQLINHACKFYEMYKEKLHFVVRCPSGGYRGYGATHSQSLEKLYLGIPGMQVVAASAAHSPGNLLVHSLQSGIPTLFVENKLDYPRELLGDAGEFWVKTQEGGRYPVMRFCMKQEIPELTVITYGGLVQPALEVMRYFLYEEEVNIEVLVPSLLSDTSALKGQVHSGKAVVAEEGVADFGWGAQVCYCLCREGIRCRKLGAQNHYIPASEPGEKKVLPMAADMIRAVREELEENGAGR